MKIDVHEITPRGGSNKASIQFGLNLPPNKTRDGKVIANLFAIGEKSAYGNDGSRSISENLWAVASHVSNRVVGSRNPEQIEWTLTAGLFTTRLKFETFEGRPFKIAASDAEALDIERFQGGFPLEQYRKSERSPLSLDSDGAPTSSFTIPVKNPAAKDGVLHCVPSFFTSDHMRDKFDYVLVDTAKTIAQMRRSNPEMIAHANRKFDGTSAGSWLKEISLAHPLDMGRWGKTPRSGIAIESGQAAVIRLVQELAVPYFPIAASKGQGEEIRAEIGYSGASSALGISSKWRQGAKPTTPKW